MPPLTSEACEGDQRGGRQAVLCYGQAAPGSSLQRALGGALDPDPSPTSASAWSWEGY